MLGVLPVNKPLGITSHDVVNQIRRRFGIRRVGHSGTLDPMASGVLVLAIGPATRFLQYLPLEPKVYVAEIEFGASTDTYDQEGEKIGEGIVPDDLMGALMEIAPKYSGLVQQIPPMHSAIKYQGKPLYKYAREGKTVVREPRTVHISGLDFAAIDSKRARATIVCSGGTYIRTLANDLGIALGCGAFLANLERVRVGKFDLESCKRLDEAAPHDILTLAEALPPMPLIQLDEEKTRHVREGRVVKIDCLPSNHLVGLIEPSGNVFSVARMLGNSVHAECVIPESSVYDSV